MTKVSSESGDQAVEYSMSHCGALPGQGWLQGAGRGGGGAELVLKMDCKGHILYLPNESGVPREQPHSPELESLTLQRVRSLI